MQDNQGASAKADRAGRASPEPASSLGHSATIPCAERLRAGFDEWTPDPTYELRHEAADVIEALYGALAKAHERWMLSCYPDNDFADWPDDPASVMNDLWKDGWPAMAAKALKGAQ